MATSIAEPTENVLVEQATRGDEAAFTNLYELHLKHVYRHIYYRVRACGDVEDLTQEVFIRAWRSIQRYKLLGRPFVAWLYTIAQNLITDYYRKQGRKHLVPMEKLLHVADREQSSEMDSVLDLELVRQLLARLPEVQQRVLTLRFVEGLDHATVAAGLGKSQGAVRVIQLRALRRLSHLLNGENKP